MSWSDSLSKAVQQTADATVFARAWLQWEPHEGQRRWLLAPRRSTAVLVTGRRWGKSEVAAVQALYHAVFHPRTRQCIVSITLDQARLSFDMALRMTQQQPLLLAFVDKIKETPFPLLRFKHGSEITVRTAAREGVYLRGHKFDRCIIDEADYLSEKLINEVIRMTLADVGGQLVLISTPRARRGLVYRELQRGLAGDPAVYAQQGRTWENPHVDHEYIRSLQGRMTVAAWQREVEGVYADDDTAVFGWQYIQSAYESAAWSLPEERQPDRRYVQGVDLAKHEDWTVHSVLDATAKPYRLVCLERYRRQPWPVVAARIREMHQRYGCHQTLIDATGVGDAVLDEVRDVAQGYIFTQRSKLDLITSLQLALEKREVQFPFIRELVDELQGYAWDDKALTTDCVMSLALAVWAAGPQTQVEFAPSIWG
ncbi:MAG: phage terminase large subunit family protein [Anaerolineae bacterium]